MGYLCRLDICGRVNFLQESTYVPRERKEMTIDSREDNVKEEKKKKKRKKKDNLKDEEKQVKSQLDKHIYIAGIDDSQDWSHDTRDPQSKYIYRWFLIHSRVYGSLVVPNK